MVEIPTRPSLRECPRVPDIEARIVVGEAILALKDAEALRDYIYAYRVCAEINSITLDAHITKLENRLKALQE